MKPSKHEIKAETGIFKIKGGDVGLTVTRSPASWNYIYIVLGFTVAIEGTAISMIFERPWNLIVYVAVTIVTFVAFLRSERLQNFLLDMKTRFEKGRTH